jgi:hypothetical protein
MLIITTIQYVSLGSHDNRQVPKKILITYLCFYIETFKKLSLFVNKLFIFVVIIFSIGFCYFIILARISKT